MFRKKLGYYLDCLNWKILSVLFFPINCIKSFFVAELTFLIDPKCEINKDIVFMPIPSILSNEVDR